VHDFDLMVTLQRLNCMAHSILQDTAFQAELQNLLIVAEFPLFHGISQNLIKQPEINAIADAMT